VVVSISTIGAAFDATGAIATPFGRHTVESLTNLTVDNGGAEKQQRRPAE
jgi:hypothetical protein